MPIKPEQKLRYGPDWALLSFAIRFFRAGGRCEWEEDGERCNRWHGEPIPGNPDKKTVLTVAHLNHIPEDNRAENLKAYCQFHHLKYDAQLHAEHARETRMKKGIIS